MEKKFRAWDNKRKEWYGESCPDILTFKGFHIFGECTMMCMPRLEDLKHLTIEQLTGKQDIKGKDLYEGDVVKVTANPHHGIGVICLGEYTLENFTKHDSQKKHLGFYIKYGKWALSLPHSIETPKGYLSSTHSIEIIGNIHENPELLK